MANYLTPLRRIAEAISAKLSYDYLCFKGSLFDEAYLSHSVSDVLCTFYDPNTIVILKGQRHPALGQFAKPTGRKPEVDYTAVEHKTKATILAIEAKWAGSSHCTAENVVWDLVRLKLIKNQYPDAVCGLLIAGHKTATEKLFSAPLFKERTQHPLHQSFNKRKNFSLVENLNHQAFLDKQTVEWKKSYPGLSIPETLTTQLEESSLSAHSSSRFVARCWSVE